jgi:hypothetical protein
MNLRKAEAVAPSLLSHFGRATPPRLEVTPESRHTSASGWLEHQSLRLLVVST